MLRKIVIKTETELVFVEKLFYKKLLEFIYDAHFGVK